MGKKADFSNMQTLTDFTAYLREKYPTIEVFSRKMGNWVSTNTDKQNKIYSTFVRMAEKRFGVLGPIVISLHIEDLEAVAKASEPDDE